MNKALMVGMACGILAQVLSFIQLQVNVKMNLMDKYPVVILLSAIPIAWLHIIAVRSLATAFDGQMWPGRLIGFGVGIVVFTAMGMIFFGEGITVKNAVCVLLAFVIMAIQVFVK